MDGERAPQRWSVDLKEGIGLRAACEHSLPGLCVHTPSWRCAFTDPSSAARPHSFPQPHAHTPSLSCMLTLLPSAACSHSFPQLRVHTPSLSCVFIPLKDIHVALVLAAGLLAHCSLVRQFLSCCSWKVCRHVSWQRAKGLPLGSGLGEVIPQII